VAKNQRCALSLRQGVHSGAHPIGGGGGDQAGLGARRRVGLLGRLGFRVEDETVPYVGLVLADDTGPAIYGVLDTSPAGASGIAPEDVLTAIDGVAFDRQALQWAIANQNSVALNVARGNETRTYQIPVGQRWQIGRLRWIGDDSQADLIATWLAHDFHPEPGQDFPLDFYSNVHGVQTVI